MPITNYQIPGVYVQQTGTSLTNINTTGINVAIVADQATPIAKSDTFNAVIAASGSVLGQLSSPMVITTSTGTYTALSGYTVTWVSGGTTVTGTYGTNFTISTPSGQPYSFLTTSGTTNGIGLPSGTVSVNYASNWGAYGTYYSFNAVTTALGSAVSGTTIVNPAALGAYFAFLNGANTVQIMPVARVSNGTSASVSDWARVFNVPPTTSVSDQTLLTNFTGVDVIVPLYGFIVSGTNTPGVSSVSSGINSYLTNQYNNGIYQRVFAGVDGTAGQVSSTSMIALASGFNSTRVSLFFPGSVNYSPGLNAQGYTNSNFNIPGYYLAAAAAGVFVAQDNVATSITNKTVAGFNSIPNQISLGDAATNYLPNGISTIFQKRDNNLWILQGLTTNITNWLTQEISINAVGDQLANNIYNDLINTSLIGGPMTTSTINAAKGTVQSSLINAVTTGLIQNYQNILLTVSPSTPTTINIAFQYAPTYPIDYIQVSLSLNTQTGNVITNNQASNLTVY